MSLEPFTSSTMSVIFNSVIMVVHEGNSSSIIPGYTNDTTPPSFTTRPQGKSTSLMDSATHGLSQGKVIAVAVMILILSIFGSLGNGLVLYVFSKKSDKVTSTIFILALAWTDIFICLIFMPFTAAILLLDARLHFAFFCKLYWFLNTSNVPLSAFIMVAIAVDRYFSICHPFMRVVTPRRARVAILCLVIIASILGSITACLYGIYSPTSSTTANTALYNSSYYNNSSDVLLLPSGNYSVGNVSLAEVTSSLTPTSSSYIDQHGQEARNRSSLISGDRVGVFSDIDNSARNEAPSGAEDNSEGMCVINQAIFSERFAYLYQKIYIMFYVISLVAVFTLYSLIYRSVAERRAWRRKQKSWSHSPMSMTAGVTEVDDMNQGDDAYNGDGDNLELSPQNNSISLSQSNSKESGSGDSNEARTERGIPPSIIKTNMAPLQRNFPHENGVSNTMLSPSAEKKTNRERRDFNFLANIRTALMLFVVTLVFIISFLPAWLMAIEAITYEIIVFYMHFIYNVANPVIYAFMNQSFRKELKRVFRRGTLLFQNG
ncbi:hypothetical protein BsWGS_26182 [Bradybaena similaris]